jgi:transcriptional regulator with XRE-family HTH domain
MNQETPFYQTVGRYLKRRGWSWNELMRQADMSSGAYNKWRLGAIPDVVTILRISQALATDTQEEAAILRALTGAAGINMTTTPDQQAEVIRLIQQQPDLAEAIQHLALLSEEDRLIFLSLLARMGKEQWRHSG